jgi:hypothetical protein
MSKRFAIALVLVLLPRLARAEELKNPSPEQLLSANTQVYVRWDGLKAHRAAYEKTALGKMMQGDTGKFFAGAFTLFNDTMASALTEQGLLRGTKPEDLQKLQNDATQASKLLGLLSEHGFVLAAEVRSVLPPAAQITLIVPDAGDKPGGLFGAAGLVAGLARAPVTTTKADGRTYHTIEAGPINIGWWTEGKHAVLIVSTDKIEDAARTMRSGDHARLTNNPLYKKVREFKDFDTAARAFLDVGALVKFASGFHKEVRTVIQDLGLDGLQSVAFYSGFEQDAERSLAEITLNGQRRGLLKLLTGKPFHLEDVPPLPTDVISWTMTSFDLAGYYDVVVKAIETVFRVVAPQELAQVKEFIKKADETLGIDIRKDLLGSLGDQLLYYSSPAEGVFTFGQTVAFKVKDRAKLEEALEKAIKGLASLTGADVSIKKKNYRGIDVREVYVAEKGFIFVPTYAICKDWLVVGYYPQGVQGFILRSQKELPAWKPGAHVRRSLEEMPKEFLSVSVSDPRPSVKQILTLAPLIGGAVRSFLPETKFDVGSIPNAHEATRHLFPNVTVVNDDGKAVRFHTRASLSLPFDVAGADAYLLASVAAGFLAAAGSR